MTSIRIAMANGRTIGSMAWVLVTACLMGCHSVTSTPSDSSHVGSARAWENTLYYALPKTTLAIEIPQVRLTMRPGRFCSSAGLYANVVQPPSDDGDFCGRESDDPFVEYQLDEPSIASRIEPDERYVYRVDRLRLPNGLGIEGALHHYGLLTGTALLPEAVPVAPRSGERHEPRSPYGEAGDSLRPDTAQSTALLIHRLQESRLALVVGYGDGAALPDRDALQLMLDETDRAIATLNGSFVDIAQQTTWHAYTIEPRNGGFLAAHPATGCTVARGREQTELIAWFTREDGLFGRTAHVDGADPVCARVKLVDLDGIPEKDEEPQERAGIAYREGREVEVVIEIGGTELTRQRVHLAQLGPIRTLTPHQLTELRNAE